MKEHYGIEVRANEIREETYQFADGLTNTFPENFVSLPVESKQKQLIAQSDGTMVPIIQEVEKRGDARKQRKVAYQEAISTVVYRKGEVSCHYRSRLGGREKVHRDLLELSSLLDAGLSTKVHMVGDGAKWIEEQMQQAFGSQSTYLIDFYHLCEYLSSAVKAMPIENKKSYLGRLKSMMKKGESEKVRKWLEKYQTNDENCPVFACRRYIENRPGQFEYHEAIKNKLPIGSGKVESSHKYLIQQRIKIPGAYWKKNNMERILKIRELRENALWEKAWKNIKAA